MQIVKISNDLLAFKIIKKPAKRGKCECTRGLLRAGRAKQLQTKNFEKHLGYFLLHGFMVAPSGKESSSIIRHA